MFWGRTWRSRRPGYSRLHVGHRYSLASAASTADRRKYTRLPTRRLSSLAIFSRPHRLACVKVVQRKSCSSHNGIHSAGIMSAGSVIPWLYGSRITVTSRVRSAWRRLELVLVFLTHSLPKYRCCPITPETANCRLPYPFYAG